LRCSNLGKMGGSSRPNMTCEPCAVDRLSSVPHAKNRAAPPSFLSILRPSHQILQLVHPLISWLAAIAGQFFQALLMNVLLNFNATVPQCSVQQCSSSLRDRNSNRLDWPKHGLSRNHHTVPSTHRSLNFREEPKNVESMRQCDK
jgi:hypothetical protein